MKNTLGRLAIMALGFAVDIPASANTKAQLLKEMCQADDRVEAALAANDNSHLKPTDSQESAFCNGFVTGWAQTVNGTAVLGDNADLTFFSFADDFNFEQGKKIFLQYVADHPESLSKQAAFVLRSALTEKNILQKRVLPLSNAGVGGVPPPSKK